MTLRMMLLLPCGLSPPPMKITPAPGAVCPASVTFDAADRESRLRIPAVAVGVPAGLRQAAQAEHAADVEHDRARARWRENLPLFRP